METRPLPFPLEIPINGPHHLDSLAAEIHRTYFFKYPPLRVRWGHNIARKRRRSIRLGSYNHVTLEIRIHPSLNSPRIPAFFIQSVIHHEYLHHVLGANHNRRFHAHERQFRYHRESKEWLRRNLFGLLGLRAKRVVPTAETLRQMALF
jgi:predicted SprT family Zn-dependent metalloprotease